MKPENYFSLNRLLLGSIALILFFDLTYALLAYSTNSQFLYISGLLNLAFLPLWIYAFLDLKLKKKGLEEKENSERRKDHLFDQSFEHVVLERQINFAKTKLQPLLVLVTTGAMAYIAWLITQINLNEESQLETAIQAAFLLFRCSISFVIARFLQGVGRGAENPHVETIAGLSLHHALILIFLSLRCFLFREGLEFLEDWTLALCLFPIGLYLLELPIRGLQYYYSSDKPKHPPQTPQWLWFYWGKEFGSDAKSTITYQFGHDLSSSLKEIGRKNILTLLPVFLISIWLGTCFHIVPTGHQGILTTFKKFKEIVDPGMHMSLPFPFGQVEVIQTSKIYRLDIGGGTGAEGDSFLWSEGGHKEETYLLFQDGYGRHDLPVEIFAINALMTYRIKDLYAYRFEHVDPRNVIFNETKSMLVQTALSLSRSSFLNQELYHSNANWELRLQKKMDELNLGVEILQFGLPQIHPPSQTSEAFQELASARNQRASSILEAEGFALEKNALQESATYKLIQEAHAEATKIVTKTEGDHHSLLHIQPVSVVNKELFVDRRLLQKLIDMKDSVRKVALLSSTPIEIQNLNLEPELEPELLNLDLE